MITRNALLGLVCAISGIAQAHAGTPLAGAEWITVHPDSLPLYADYLTVYRLGFDIDLPPETRASLLFGMDDPRLMDANLNIYGLANGPGESYMRLEVASDSLRLFRKGYTRGEENERRLAAFPASGLRRRGNHIEIAVNFGHLDIYVNGEKAGYAGINPLGNGGDYIAFPALATIGVDIPADVIFPSEASAAPPVRKDDGTTRAPVIGDITVSHFREPRNIITRLKGPFRQSGRFRLPERSLPEMRVAIETSPDKQIAKATATATAMGIYDLYLNGRRVNEEYYLPGSTQYNKTHLYHTFDLTGSVKPGRNEIVVQLGEGWWSGPSTFVGENWNFYGDRPAFLGVVEVEYTDGTSDRFATHPDAWEYSVDGPLAVGSFFNGEIYDSRKDALNRKPGTLLPRKWSKAERLPSDKALAPVSGGWNDVMLRSSFGDRVLPVDTLTAVSMTEPRPGVYVYDMGQNMAAVPHIVFDGMQEGDTVTIRHGEVLYPDMPQYAANVGMVMTENLRAAMCRDMYVASGGREIFSPRHTLHGYRYLELTGLDAPLPLEAVRSIPVSSVHGFTAHFECSDSLVNRLWENIKWSTLSNFISIPTDCPQRNERLGWMGDISVYAPTAVMLADVAPLLRQYLQTMRDCQEESGRFPDVVPTGFGFGGFLWGSAGITVPWAYYCRYGDTETLREHYPAMRRYIDYVLRETLDPESGVMVQNRAWGDLGDWLSMEYEKTDKSLLWECYLIHDLTIMSETARLLGETDDAIGYENLADERKSFFARTYVDPDTQKTRWSLFDAGRAGTPVDTQSSYALPLAMGIYDSPRFRENFVATVERENLTDAGTVCPPYSLMTGFIGTAWILEALSAIDRDDLAYRMLTSTAYPSWLYPVTQGATTVWERLDSYTHKDGFGSNNSMNSFNHYSFGSVGHWLLTRCLGIRVDAAGNVTVNPRKDPTGSLTGARGWIETPAGRVESSWGKLPD